MAKLAAHYAKFYKHVVHDIEMFVWKAEVEHRLAGLYAIDAIIRQAHTKNPKDAYVRRFLIRLADTIAAVKKVPEPMLPKVQHVVEEWQKRGIYTATQIEEAGGEEFILRDGREGTVTPRASQEKLASLLSIIKQKKEENDHPGHSSEERPAPFDDRDRRRADDDRGASNRQEYDDRRGSEQSYERRSSSGIMGDAPGAPVASRVRRASGDRDRDDNVRDSKKARGSRWGPPRSNDRPAPIVTSLERESEYGRDAGRPAYESSRQAPLLQSPHGGPPRHEEWNRGGDRNAPSSHGTSTPWPPNESGRSPQSGNFGRLDRGPPSSGRNDANAYEQRSPFPRSNDRRSPHMQGGPRSNRIPGTSGEICRNFLAGRCTYGDQCWHIHDPQNQPRPEIADPKRKTMLCKNFPLGTCRFGNNCSFAHGEEDLDKSARFQARGSAPGYDEQAGGRWQPSPSGPSAISDNGPSHQARSYGSPQAVYNEAHGDRGTRGGDPSVSYANAAAPSPGGRRLPPNQQPAPMAPPQGYPGSYSSATSPFGVATGPSFANQAPAYPDQGRNVAPPPAPSKVLADDDDADTVEPEFTLQYDDDD